MGFHYYYFLGLVIEINVLIHFIAQYDNDEYLSIIQYSRDFII